MNHPLSIGITACGLYTPLLSISAEIAQTLAIFAFLICENSQKQTRPSIHVLSILRLESQDSYHSFQIALSFGGRELFDCIPQHGARHCFVAGLEEFFFGVKITLSDLAQHPADGLVD